MEKQLLIIGNGFDLQCGLKSSYKDFYDQIISHKRYPQFEQKDDVYIQIDFWQTLLWYSSKQDNQWCDIERIIKETLFNINRKGGFAEIAFNSYRDYFENRIAPKIIVTDAQTYIIHYCYDYLQRIAKLHRSDVLTSSYIIILDQFNKHLLEQLHGLERQFCQYLKEQLKGNDNYRDNTYRLFCKLMNFDINRNKSALKNVHILSFNYTSPLQLEELGSYNHVHSKLCKEECNECPGSSIVFGIDDKTVKEQESDYSKIFSKTYRTLGLDEIQSSVLPSYDIYNPLTIKFYGHSLNEADYSYFQSIFDYYHIYDNPSVALEFYYSPYKMGVLEDVTDAVYNLINQYGLTLNNKDQGKNLMHKLILEHRVRIKEIK